MSYYLFPKGNVDLSKGFSVEISNIPQEQEDTLSLSNIKTQKHRLSPSLTNYLFELQESTHSVEFQQLQSEIFTYSKGILHKYSLTHLPVFFEIIEIIQTMHLNHYIDTITKNTPLSIFSFSNRRNNPEDGSNRRNNPFPEGNVSYKKKGDLDAIKTIREPYKRNHENPKDHYFLAEPDIPYSLETFKGPIFTPFRNKDTKPVKHSIIIANAEDTANTSEMIIQLCMALCIQAKKGIFIWKIGETYNDIMLDILFLLSSFYEKIHFIKPCIMDNSKSEKYVVCKGFLNQRRYEFPDSNLTGNFVEEPEPNGVLFNSINLSSFQTPTTNFVRNEEPWMRNGVIENGYNLYSYLYPLVSQMSLLRLSSHIHIDRILKMDIPYFFVNKLEEINYIFGQVQLEQLHYLSLLISHKYRYDKVLNISKMNIQKTQEWLSKHHYFLQHL